MGYKMVLVADSHQKMDGDVRDLPESAFDVVMMVADEKSFLEIAGMVKPNIAVVDLSVPCQVD